MARSDGCPAARISAGTGAGPVAKATALADTASRTAKAPLPTRPSKSLGPIRLSELHPARIGHRQRYLRTTRDRLALDLGDQRHDPCSQVVGHWHVDGHELDPTIPQGHAEGRVSAEPVRFGDCPFAPVTVASSCLQAFRPLSTSVNRASTPAPRKATKSSIPLR